MKKQITTLGLIVLILLASLAGCNSATDEPTDAENNAQSTSTADNTPLEANVLDGVEMIIQDVSPSGLSFSIDNQTDNEYTYGEDFALYTLNNGTWERVEAIIEYWAFNDIGYTISPNSTTDERTIDWLWLFGELPDGEYRIQKNVLLVRQPGDFDSFVIEQTFSIQ